jgi:hypothetical protein
VEGVRGGGGSWHPENNITDPMNSKKTNYGEDIDLSQAFRMYSIGCMEDEDWRRKLWSTPPSPEDDFDEDEEYDEDIFNDLKPSRDLVDSNRTENQMGNDSDEADYDEEENAPRDSNFCKNITELVVTAVHENHPVDSIILEIQGFKFAQNKVLTISSC